MPNRDKTGPEGKGPMTGLGRGQRVEGQEIKETENNSEFGVGRWFRRFRDGRGNGRGIGAGRGRGRGRGQGRGLGRNRTD